MGIVFTRAGPLVLAEASVEQEAFQRELRKLDARLFLERHLLNDGRPVWTVQEHVGERAGGPSPYRTVCYWDDDHGDPLPLTWRLLDKVKQLEGGWETVMERMLETTEGKVAMSQAALRDDATEIAADVLPRMKDTRSAVLPRSQSLRMSRDRQRANGKVV